MNIISPRSFCRFILVAVLLMGGSAMAESDAPARAPLKECKWKHLSSEAVGLAVWVQECDFGFRKLDFIFQENSLAVRYSDTNKPDPVIDVIDLLPYETIETGLWRIFLSRTDKSIGRRCVLREYPGAKPANGAKHYIFRPSAAYRVALKSKARPDEIPEPPCGEWGEGPDGVQYFAAWPQGNVRKVLFVREGQDEPLFDAQSLQLISPDNMARN